MHALPHGQYSVQRLDCNNGTNRMLWRRRPLLLLYRRGQGQGRGGGFSSCLVVANLCCGNGIVNNGNVIFVLWFDRCNIVALRSRCSCLLVLLFSCASLLLGGVRLLAAKVPAAPVGTAEHAAANAQHERTLTRVHSWEIPCQLLKNGAHSALCSRSLF